MSLLKWLSNANGLAIQYIKSTNQVDSIIIVDNIKQLEIMHSFKRTDTHNINFDQWVINDKDFIDPRSWPQK